MVIEDRLVCIDIDYIMVCKDSNDEYFDDLAAIRCCVSLNLLHFKKCRVKTRCVSYT